MADASELDRCRRLIRRRVSAFVTDRRARWKAPAIEVFDLIKHHEWPAVIFGGTIRSLLVGRRGERPRDIDIVVGGTSSQAIRHALPSKQIRINRFGGIRMHHGHVDFDIWPVDETWAFTSDAVLFRDFERLPATTFLNIEAVAVDVWPMRSKARQVYTYRGSIFDALAERAIDINQEENPFPTLCVLRALVIAQSLRFALKPRLAKYIACVGSEVPSGEFANLQIKHYGRIRLDEETIRAWVSYVSTMMRRAPKANVVLPTWRASQMELWGNTPVRQGEVHVWTTPKVS